MKYMGSKDRIAKYILPLILKHRKPYQNFVELFAGGMNLTDKVDGYRIANDINFYLIEMFKHLTNGWEPPKSIDRNFYNAVKAKKSDYAPHLVGYIGFCCSYSGKWFGGYAGLTNTKIGTTRDYQLESYKNVSKQINNLQGVVFVCNEYQNVKIPSESIVYADPPYQNTTAYSTAKFNSNELFEHLRYLKSIGHTIFLSEYDAPDDFKCIWEGQLKSSLSANGKIGGSKLSTEKLFKL